jgi:hypothetical protein
VTLLLGVPIKFDFIGIGQMRFEAMKVHPNMNRMEIITGMYPWFECLKFDEICSQSARKCLAMLSGNPPHLDDLHTEPIQVVS